MAEGKVKNLLRLAGPSSTLKLHVERLYRFLVFSPVLLASAVFAAEPVSLQPVTVVDVLLLYTPQARDGAGGTTPLLKQINVAVMEANRTFQNSRVNVRVRVVLAARLDYLESGSVATDLERLRNPSDGFMDSAPAYRNRYGADLVCLVTETGDDWLFYGLQGPSAGNAFSIIRRPALTGSNFLPVVLGFNFGCQLERGYADSAGAFPYAYGYSFWANGTLFSTADAFSGERLPLFSNPDVLYEGVAAGVPVGEVGAANNALVINQTGPIVATFRGKSPRTKPPQITITSPATNVLLRSGSNVRLAANVSDPDGRVRRVDFYDGTNWLGAVGSRPFVALWRNVPAGQHSLFASATDDQGATTVSAALPLTLFPSNDHFTNRTRIEGSELTVHTENSLATGEPAEPIHDGWTATHSLWWTWTAPANGIVWLDTIGSRTDTALAVYRGSVLAELTPVASTPSFVSENYGLRFRVESGVTYQIAVDGLYQAVGNITLNLKYLPSPANDDFARRALIKGNRARIQASVVAASLEQGEPNSGETSLWWSWVAPAAGAVKLRLQPPDDSLGFRFTLYSGDNLTELSGLEQGYPNWDITRQVQAGDRLQIAVVTGVAPDYPCTNCTFTLDLAFSPIAANDNFTNRTRLVGSHITLTNSLLGTTLEEGEPNPYLYGYSIWWSWTAPASGQLDLTSASGHILEVYAGSKLSELIGVGSSSMWVKAGTTYAIKATGDPTEVALELGFSPSPINDDFARRTRVSGSHVHVPGSLFASTVEENEPDTWIGQSIWWSWTPRVSGWVSLSAEAAIHVYAGNELTNLTLIGANYSSLNFEATAGTAYAIKITGPPLEIVLDLLLSTVRIASPVNGARFHASSNVPVQVTTTANDDPKRVDLFLNDQPVADFAKPPYSVVLTNLASGDYTLTATAKSRSGLVRNSPPVTFRVTPTNDDFTNRTVIVGSLITLTNSATVAVREPGEPWHGVAPWADYWNNSIWWSWMAPASGLVELSFPNGQYFGVYVGNSLTNLTPVTMTNTTAAFEVVGGTTYSIATIGADEVILRLKLSTLRIVHPTSGDIVGGTNLHITTESTGIDGVLRRVEFFQNAVSLGVVTNPPFNLVWSNVVAGDYQLTATGINTQGLQQRSASVSITVLPPNDHFSNSIALPGDFASIAGSTVHATIEPGQPAADDRDVWYSWIAPHSGTFGIGISSEWFGCARVYTGTSLSDLTFLVQTPTFLGGTRFTAVAGTVYHISVADLYRRSPFTLTIREIPPNDNFADRITITDLASPIIGHNLGATVEPNECYFCDRHSVWWTWTAPRSGRLFLNPSATEGFMSFGLFTGPDLSSLLEVSRVNPAIVNGIAYDVTEGTTYQIKADDKWNKDWSVVFSLNFTPNPENDNFADRLPVTGANLVLMGDNRQATSESLEPNHGSAERRSLWYSWTAPATGMLATSNAGMTVAVYSGADFLDLVKLTNSGGFHRVAAGVPYAIAVDGGPREFSVGLSFIPIPTNDSFTNRATLAGMSATVSGSMRFASVEPGEPYYWSPLNANKSIWYEWTAPATGFARVRCPGLLLRVFNGGAIPNLIPVTNPTSNEATFDAIAGQLYQIAVGGDGALPDDYTLSVELAKVTIISPTNNTVFPAPADVPILVSTIDLEGAVRVVDYFAGTNWLGAVTGQPFAFVWTNASPGAHRLTAKATDEFGFGTTSRTVEIRVSAGNDEFANRIAFAGTSATFSATNTSATSEPGEFLPGGAAGKTLWWSWTAPSSGAVTLTVVGTSFSGSPAPQPPIIIPLSSSVSAGGVKAGQTDSASLNSVIIIGPGWPPFPSPPPGASNSGPVVAVYTGDTLTNLTLCASNTLYYCDWWFGCGWLVQPAFTFPVASGTTYQISLDGINGSAGAATFNFTFTPPPPPPPPPANDHFTNRFILFGSAISTNGTTIQASREPWEPGHGLDDNAQTVWWSWTAPASGEVVADAGYSKNIAVYTGTTLSELTPVAVDDYLVRFYAHAGMTYQVAVASPVGSETDFTLSLTGPPPPPAIDESHTGRLPDGRYRIRVVGVRGQSFVLQASGVNHTWQTILIDTLQGDYVDIFENQPWQPKRLYRVMPLEALFPSPQPQPLLTANAASLPPLRIDSFGLRNDGRFALRVTGPAGQPFRIQTSTDLQNWSEVTQGIVAEGAMEFTDGHATNHAARFYRILPP